MPIASSSSYVASQSPVVAAPVDPLSSLLFFLSPQKVSKVVWGSTVSFLQFPAKTDSQLQKLVPVISKVGGDASHGSHRAVAAPMSQTAILVFRSR